MSNRIFLNVNIHIYTIHFHALRVDYWWCCWWWCRSWVLMLLLVYELIIDGVVVGGVGVDCWCCCWWCRSWLLVRIWYILWCLHVVSIHHVFSFSRNDTTHGKPNYICRVLLCTIASFLSPLLSRWRYNIFQTLVIYNRKCHRRCW